ncbi:dicarboxylate/amino acid:cation symporter [Leptolyngbyaceae cyanobacterium CCMR0082]|uniref:Dicarboxylate/amino acid:cation symporter n=2 Tax=Adonisia turfae TaxID=2950184 RepID=A0A6M0SHI5_9CYAN|nr:cation:dicarboxylase symporter family transporter [Adonisia turfae]MDV3348216.1 cation:dicarboxylase symporter family transporter [Leptothoe sp. LEGE 181152]NEZ55297.1 dicarboxylate/amino acid:cation symporter [Adonisia turfae CCMR0081]NEZ67463.1 dicarboxylate/amino acid:cation symporter [Adonisia turfae CCMR0082]
MTINPATKQQFWSNTLSLKWLRSPWAILISVALAIYVGTTHQEFAILLAPLGNFYLGLLKMCVLPILLAAITTSIGRLMQSSNAAQYIKRILVIFPLGLLSASGLTVILAAMMGPGRNLSTKTLESLGVLVNNSGIDLEMALTGPIPEESSRGMASFLISLVPENIFNALSQGETLKVLIFSIIVGISLGLIRDRVTEPCFDILEAIYKTFNQLIDWLTMILPLGLFSLLAYQLSQQGLDVMLSMINFVIATLVTFLVIYVLSTIVVWQQSKMSIIKVLSALREPTILALATSSSLACLPSAIAQLTEALNFSRQTVNLVTPLSITLCRFGSVIYFALGSVFVMQLYDKPIGPVSIMVVIVGSIFAGMATAGVTGILTLTMLGIVLEPLQLPLEAVLVLFVAIDPIMDPFRTLGIVHTGIATTAVIADKSSGKTIIPGLN